MKGRAFLTCSGCGDRISVPYSRLRVHYRSRHRDVDDTECEGQYLPRVLTTMIQRALEEQR